MIAPEFGQGVVRQPLLVQRQLVEAAPARLTADVPVDHRLAVLFEGQAVVHRLADRLQAEVDLGVSQGQALAVHRAGGDGELLRVDSAELGDVVGDPPGGVRPNALEHFLEVGQQAGEVWDRQVALDGVLDQAAVLTRDPFELGVRDAMPRVEPVERRDGLPDARVVAQDAAAAEPVEQFVARDGAVRVTPERREESPVLQVNAVRHHVRSPPVQGGLRRGGLAIHL
jgi:hypothetical protein